MKVVLFFLLTFLAVLLMFLSMLYPYSTFHTFRLYAQTYGSLVRNQLTSYSAIEKLYTSYIVLLTAFFFFFFWHVVPYYCKRILKRTIKKKTRKIISYALVTLVIYNAVANIKVHEYFIPYFFETTFYQENYTFVESSKIKTLKKPKNLIIILAESFEKDYAYKDLFGENLLPNLSKQAGFSFDNYKMISGSQNTLSSIMSSMCAIPITPTSNRSSDTKITYTLPKVLCLPDILHKKGYENYAFFTSAESYSIRYEFLKTHHFDKVAGADSIRRDENDNGLDTFGDIKDSRLFEYAQDEITKLQSSDKPFFMFLETINTHEPEGYVEDFCAKKYLDDRDPMLCSDRNISSFIDFLKTTPKYKDTLIFVMGDHETRNLFFLEKLKKLEKRSLYHLFINAPTPKNLNRTFATIDMTPTLLEAIGFKIDAKGFGLGRSLYQTKPTLLEKFTKEYFESEVRKKSDFYINLLTEK